MIRAKPSLNERNGDVDPTERFDYIPRTLSYIDNKSELQSISESEVLAMFAEPVVILGSPGLGKTSLLDGYGREAGHRFIRATSFLREPEAPLPSGERLVIDGLDEVAAVSETDPLQNVLTKLLARGKPPFVLSCREAEWRGVTANLDIAGDYGTHPRLLHLDPLTREQALAALSQVFDGGRAETVVRKLDEAGLFEIYSNPLTLDFVAAVIEADGEIPSTRADLYAQAVEQLRIEHNRRHQQSNLALMSPEAALDAAGAIMAVMLVTGADTLRLRGSSADTPSLSRLTDLAPSADLLSIVRSKLFRVTGRDGDEVRPLHRTVAEYVGASWLARMVERHGNPDRAVARVLSLISTELGIPSSLRGMAAWLPRFSPARLGPKIVASDPYAVLRYGDPDGLPPVLAAAMLDSLLALSETDPFFRSAHWGRLSAAGLVQPALEERVRTILADMALPSQVRFILLDAIHLASRGAAFADGLLDIVVDPARLPGERSGAQRAMRKVVTVDQARATILRLTQLDDDKSPELAVSLLDDVGAAHFEAELVADVLVFGAQLGKTRNERHSVLPQTNIAIGDGQITPLLDALANRLLPMRDPEKWWQYDSHPGWREIGNMIYHLIDRLIAISSPAITPKRMWSWLRVSERARNGEARAAIDARFKTDAPLRQALQRLVLFAPGTEADFFLLHHRIPRVSMSLDFTPEDARVHLGELVARNDPAEEMRWHALVNHLRGEDRRVPKDVQKLAKPYAAGDERMVRFLRTKPQRTELHDFARKYRRQDRDRARRREIQWACTRTLYETNRESVETAEFKWIVEPAKAFLGLFQDVQAETPEDRVKEWLGEEVTASVLKGLDMSLVKNDLPSAETVAEDYGRRKEWNWVYPLLAAGVQRVSAGRDLGDVHDEVLIVMGLALEHNNYVEHKMKSGLAETLRQEFRRRGTVYERYLRLLIEPILRAGHSHVPGLYRLLRAPEDKPFSVKLAAEWLNAHPGLPVDVEQELVGSLLYAPTAQRQIAWKTLEPILAKRLAQKADEDPERLFWAGIAFAIRPETTIPLLSRPDEATKQSLWAYSRHLYERYAEHTRLSDVLRERGESNTIIFASALRWLWMIENNVVLAANSSPSSGELLDLLERRPGIRASLKQVATIREIMGSGIAAALHRTFADKDDERADLFFTRLGDGVGLASDSPILHLRERLLRTRASNRARMAEAERVALCIKAWNAYRTDRPMHLLVWRNRGAAREPLPTAA